MYVCIYIILCIHLYTHTHTHTLELVRFNMAFSLRAFVHRNCVKFI